MKLSGNDATPPDAHPGSLPAGGVTAPSASATAGGEDAWAHFGRAALAAALTGDLEKTARLLERYLWAADTPPFAALNDLLSLYNQTGGHDRKLRAIRRLIKPQPNPKVAGTRNRQVMVFALPKSAGTSVVQTLAATLRVKAVASGSDDARVPGYSAPVLEPTLLEALSKKTLLHQTHAMPWAENLESLRRYCSPRFLVHLRDPRDVLLSYYYMAEKYELHRLRFLVLCPDYDRLLPVDRLELLARHVYPRFLEWIIGWVAVADAMAEKAMVSSFESFKRDPEAFFRRLTVFLSGQDLPLAAVRTTHFRKGSIGQDDDPLMPSALRAELFQQIPPELIRRFGWHA